MRAGAALTRARAGFPAPRSAESTFLPRLSRAKVRSFQYFRGHERQGAGSRAMPASRSASVAARHRRIQPSPEAPEGAAGGDRHPLVQQEVLGPRRNVAVARVRDIHPEVEGACRLQVVDAACRQRLGRSTVVRAVVGRSGVHVRLLSLDRRQRRELVGHRDAADRRLLQAAHRRGQTGRGDQVAHSDAGHGIGLREREHAEHAGDAVARLGFERREADVRLAPGEALVDLVAEDPQVVAPGEREQLVEHLAREHRCRADSTASSR